MKNEIEGLLKGTKRKGIETLCQYMNDCGFYTSPCSTNHHLAEKGGLAKHSLNVYGIMRNFYLTLYPSDNTEKMLESIIICALLHDIGKMGDFGKENYIPNMIKSQKKDENGEYPLIQSEAKPYATNPELLYIPHEVRSISIIAKFIELTEDEYFAILYHNGLYGDFKYEISGKETPLYLLLHFADMWASRVTEIEKEGETE